MSSIIKTKAFVLSKLEYGDTSKIVNLYTEDFGRLSGIIKGARSPKSKIGKAVDVLNFIDLVFYKKKNRDLQVISQADLISHYPNIKSDLEKLKYASAIIELVLRLTVEDDPHKRLFRGIEKMLSRIDSETTQPILLFVMFLKFFIEEIGYGLVIEKCSSCQKELVNTGTVFYSHESGFLCRECSTNFLITDEFSLEHFTKIICLSQRNNQCTYTEEELKKIITFFEKFLIYHVDKFQGLNSLKIY
ncbi:MAG: DNA repair protein RecO [Bacteroidota bacterium]